MQRIGAFALTALLLSAGCSSDGDDGNDDAADDMPSANPSEPAPGTLIEGVWESPCLPGDGGRIVSRRLVLSVNGQVFELFNDGFSRTEGDGESLRVFATRGAFSEGLPEDMREVADGIPIDIAVEQLTLTPLLSPVADDYNAGALCGSTDWVPGVERDVSGCDEVDDSEAPRTDFNRYFVDDGGTLDVRADDLLFLGPLTASTDPEARPELDRSVAFTRRPEGG